MNCTDILPKDILNEAVNAICSRYKIGHESVLKQMNETMHRHPELIKKIQKNPVDITRLKAYKTFIKDVKKQIYYQLRQYHQNTAQETDLKQHLASLVLNQGPSDDIDKIIKGLLSSHVSTQERLPWYQEFYQTLFNLVDPGKSIIDIGCGIHPLSYPFEKNNLNTYLAIDKDPVVIDTLTIFAPRVAPVKLIPVCMDINHITWSDYLTAQFDLAFVLKLIPVLHRQNKSALKQLIEIPAKQILLTGNIEAMTRKETIRRKERRMLQDFIAMTGRQISGNFEVGNEFGFVIR